MSKKSKSFQVKIFYDRHYIATFKTDEKPDVRKINLMMEDEK